MSLSTEKGFNMSKINIYDLTEPNEGYLVELDDSSLESINGGSLLSGVSAPSGPLNPAFTNLIESLRQAQAAKG
jgi:hypothetical protein